MIDRFLKFRDTHQHLFMVLVVATLFGGLLLAGAIEEGDKQIIAQEESK